MKAKNMVTNIAGLAGAFATIALGAGYHVGHFAGTDFLALVQALSVGVIGWATGKAPTTPAE